MNPIPNSVRTFEPSLTGRTWDEALGEFEYKNFLKEYYAD
jgi:hypothetical protein